MRRVPVLQVFKRGHVSLLAHLRSLSHLYWLTVTADDPPLVQYAFWCLWYEPIPTQMPKLRDPHDLTYVYTEEFLADVANQFRTVSHQITFSGW